MSKLGNAGMASKSIRILVFFFLFMPLLYLRRHASRFSCARYLLLQAAAALLLVLHLCTPETRITISICDGALFFLAALICCTRCL